MVERIHTAKNVQKGLLEILVVFQLGELRRHSGWRIFNIFAALLGDKRRFGICRLIALFQTFLTITAVPCSWLEVEIGGISKYSLLSFHTCFVGASHISEYLLLLIDLADYFTPAIATLF